MRRTSSGGGPESGSFDTVDFVAFEDCPVFIPEAFEHRLAVLLTERFPDASDGGEPVIPPSSFLRSAEAPFDFIQRRPAGRRRAPVAILVQERREVAQASVDVDADSVVGGLIREGVRIGIALRCVRFHVLTKALHDARRNKQKGPHRWGPVALFVAVFVVVVAVLFVVFDVVGDAQADAEGEEFVVSFHFLPEVLAERSSVRHALRKFSRHCELAEDSEAVRNVAVRMLPRPAERSEDGEDVAVGVPVDAGELALVLAEDVTAERFGCRQDRRLVESGGDALLDFPVVVRFHGRTLGDKRPGVQATKTGNKKGPLAGASC